MNLREISCDEVDAFLDCMTELSNYHNVVSTKWIISYRGKSRGRELCSRDVRGIWFQDEGSHSQGGLVEFKDC